jgi:hypothetical protein
MGEVHQCSVPGGRGSLCANEDLTDIRFLANADCVP